MPFQYVGNPAGVHAPDTAPAVGQFPTIMIPTSGDAPTGGLFEQPFENIADYLAFLMTQIGPATPPYFGDGSDGALTLAGGSGISGVVKNYTNLTINSGGNLISSRSIIRVNGTLTVDAAGLLRDNGPNGVGNIGGQGTDGTGASITTPCPIAGGSSGGSGQTTAGSAGFDFAIDGSTLGLLRNAERAYAGYSALGGAGGSGTSGAGGASGCAAAVAADLVSTDLLFGSLFTPGFVCRARTVNHGAGDIGTIAELVALRGGAGGGGGGGVGGAPGGGAGAGGGVLIIIAKKVVLGSATCIQALGGNGTTTATNNTGGGGGGGGGRVFLFHGGISGSTLTTACVAGGTAGASGGGSGVAGSAGSTGTLYVKQIA